MTQREREFLVDYMEWTLTPQGRLAVQHHSMGPDFGETKYWREDSVRVMPRWV